MRVSDPLPKLILPFLEYCEVEKGLSNNTQRNYEQYLKLFAKLYELDCVSIRPFNVFGPNQKGNSSYSCALSAWLYCIKNNKPIRFDGDGTQKRDLKKEYKYLIDY